MFGLDDKDVDIILFTDPRTGRGSTSLISSKDIKKYKRHINKNVKVIQELMNVMKEKNTKKINKLYLKSSEVADHVVFVSEWLKENILRSWDGKRKNFRYYVRI